MSSHTKDSSLQALNEYSKYYFRGSDLIVIVQNYAFCVPSIFFTRESRDFEARLAARSDDNNKKGLEKSRAVETGSSSNKPYTIVIQPEENVTPDDFAKLCWIFFNPTFSIYDESLDTWKVILRLANQWHFDEVKKLAFRELEAPGKFDMTLVEKIVLYREYDADMSYLEPLYAELLTRPEPLSLEEGIALELRTTLMISGARERLRATLDQPLSIPSPLPPALKETVLQMVRCVFSGAPAPSYINGKTSTMTTTTSSSSLLSTSFGSGSGGSGGSTTSTLGVNGNNSKKLTTNITTEVDNTNGSNKSKKNKKKGVSLYDYDDFYSEELNEK